MTRMLLVGYDPDVVDYSDPALPPGMNAEKVRAGIAIAVKSGVDRGWAVDLCYLRADADAGAAIERQLAAASYDCVVVGGGVRLPPSKLQVFEAVINAIHRAAPRTAIAFNTTPHDSADAAARWVEVKR